jgi:hypothetical protein
VASGVGGGCLVTLLDCSGNNIRIILPYRPVVQQTSLHILMEKVAPLEINICIKDVSYQQIYQDFSHSEFPIKNLFIIHYY